MSGAFPFLSPEEIGGGVFFGCSTSPDGEAGTAFFCSGGVSAYTAGSTAFFSGLAAFFFSLPDWGTAGSCRETDFSEVVWV